MADAAHWCAVSVTLRGEGRLTAAVEAAQRALAIDPDNVEALSCLAHALRWQERHEEARRAAEQALARDPRHAPAWFNLGAALQAEGRVGEGIDAYRKALALAPEFTEAWSNLGGALCEQGDSAGGIDAYRQALAINPALVPVWSNLGHALRDAGQLPEAEQSCRKAIELDPTFGAAWNNLGNVRRDQGDPAAAAEAYRRAVAAVPAFGEAWSNLGNVLHASGSVEESIRAHEQAVALEPGNARLHFNLGVTLKHCGRIADALQCYRRSLELAPAFADAHWNFAVALLTSGALREGWEEYEWRWRRSRAEARRYDFREWDGDVSRPLRLLLWGEQGVGDEIIYASMIADLAGSPLTITLEADPRLVSLFGRSFPGVAVVPRRDPPAITPHDFDCHAPLASLGRWLRPSFERYPRRPGYLVAEPHRVQGYRRVLGAGAAPVVGISWKSSNEEYGALKSSRLSDWASIFRESGVTWADLQYGDTALERQAVERQAAVAFVHLPELDLFNDLEGLAALCAACDLVVTVSNVTAHMAGAVGRPVWLLVPQSRGKLWYWFTGRCDSPWYPTMRIFTQRAAGSWRDVLGKVARELAALARREG